MRYSVTDELPGFSFHDALLQSVSASGRDMIWALRDVVVAGTSGFGSACSQNPGEDRCAEPILRLTFQAYAAVSLVRLGYSVSTAHGVEIEKIPALALEPAGFQAFLPGSRIHGVCAVPGSETVRVDFSSADGAVYALELTAAHTVAEWESYGTRAWYLEK